MAVGTHKDTDAYAAADAVMVIAGVEGTAIRPFPVETVAATIGTLGIPIVGTDGTNARIISVNTSGHVSINDGGNSITVDGTVSISGTPTVTVSGTVTVGTHAVTQSGAWNVGVTSISAGTTTMGATLDAGWDTAGKVVSRGLSQSTSNTTENTLLSADASNLYNITDVAWQVYAGSTAPGAFRKLTFRLGIAGTVFHTVYIPPTANAIVSGSLPLKEPVRSALNQAITIQLDAAGGASYEYSAIVLAYKTAS